MALDREKSFKNAERLLKSGKTQAALEEFKKLLEDSPRDLPMLNRVGDLLSTLGRMAEAIGYYERIAEQFALSGFFPKAIAIHKKILKLDPQRVEALVHLGDLYLKQRLPGEARGYLLRAADRMVQARQIPRARAIYEKLAQAEPEEPLHRVRLAEARAAEGDTARGAAELIEVAVRFQRAGRLEESERTFRRAAELAPQAGEATAGLASVLLEAGKEKDALNLLEAEAARPRAPSEVIGALFHLYEQRGRDEASLKLLGGPLGERLKESAFEQVLELHLSRGTPQAFWSRVDRLLSTWKLQGRLAESVALLERLSRAERPWHLPALRRLPDACESRGDRRAAGEALECLIRALRETGHGQEAEDLLPRLGALAPASSLLDRGTRAPSEGAPQDDGAEALAAPAVEPTTAAPEAETPAVPISPAEIEQVSGQLTEADVFQKYGLQDEALRKLREVTQRFPGHVQAQERLVASLKHRSAPDLNEALAGLAFARRAAGDAAGAREAAREAALRGPLPEAIRLGLERLGLIPVLTPAPPMPPPETKPAPPLEAPRPEVAPGPPEEVEIEFEEEAEPQAAPEQPAVLAVKATPAQAPEREPPKDVMEEIRFYLDQAMASEARKKIAALRTLGYSGGLLAAFEVQAASLEDAVPAEISVEVVDDGADAASSRLDDEDLRSFAGELERELGLIDEGPSSPSAFDEQSLAEVFEAFKKHVENEVAVEDHRTHYDLGIAYKEMGLLDDAIAEFYLASRSKDLFGEALSMIAICHREKGETQEAAACYHRAIEAGSLDGALLSGLRYDLAEVLLDSGDARGALDQFQRVQSADPTYRDVGSRIDEVRARLGS